MKKFLIEGRTRSGIRVFENIRALVGALLLPTLNLQTEP